MLCLQFTPFLFLFLKTFTDGESGNFSQCLNLLYNVLWCSLIFGALLFLVYSCNLWNIFNLKNYKNTVSQEIIRVASAQGIWMSIFPDWEIQREYA